MYVLTLARLADVAFQKAEDRRRSIRRPLLREAAAFECALSVQDALSFEELVAASGDLTLNLWSGHEDFSRRDAVAVRRALLRGTLVSESEALLALLRAHLPDAHWRTPLLLDLAEGAATERPDAAAEALHVHLVDVGLSDLSRTLSLLSMMQCGPPLEWLERRWWSHAGARRRPCFAVCMRVLAHVAMPWRHPAG